MLELDATYGSISTHMLPIFGTSFCFCLLLVFLLYLQNENDFRILCMVQNTFKPKKAQCTIIKDGPFPPLAAARGLFPGPGPQMHWFQDGC